MNDQIIQQQITYYRARAGEYDEWFYRLGRYDHGDELNRQWFKEVEQVIRALHSVGPVGRILELAAGTGNWTQELLKIGQHITALDISPEMLEINRRKVKAPNVAYREQNLFEWDPAEHEVYDMVFFGFWLSHVPLDRINTFLDRVRRSLRPGGQLFIVDSRFEPTSTARDHILHQDGSRLVSRTLNDGREYKVVKIFYEPDDLKTRLAAHDFDAVVQTTEQYFIYARGVKVG